MTNVSLFCGETIFCTLFFKKQTKKRKSHGEFRTKSYCVGGTYESATISIESDVTKTEQKLIFGKGVQYKRKKSMIVGENTIAAERLSTGFKNIKRSSAIAGRKLATNVMNHRANF